LFKTGSATVVTYQLISELQIFWEIFYPVTTVGYVWLLSAMP